MSAPSEQELIRQAQRGSKEAFSELVQRFQGPLYRFLLARSVSSMDAEDRAQDAFLNAFRYIHTYNPRWQFGTWLYKIALRAVPLTPVGTDEMGNETAASELDPLSQCIQDNDHDNLWPIAKRVLSREQFDALWLRYVEDLSVREISIILNRSNTWVKVALFRARRVLAGVLQNEHWIEANV